MADNCNLKLSVSHTALSRLTSLMVEGFVEPDDRLKWVFFCRAIYYSTILIISILFRYNDLHGGLKYRLRLEDVPVVSLSPYHTYPFGHTDCLNPCLGKLDEHTIL